jgi:menaquinone C8-methyltransferase
MYLLEPILNAFYRLTMRGVMDFEQVATHEPPAPPAGQPLLLYIHVPFCETLCPYCSFHRFLYDADAAGVYFEALRDELRMYADRGYDFQSIYVGGGTPTIAPGELGRTLSLARELFAIREVSVETNPNALTPELLPVLQDIGINRLSVGVQTFDDELLRRIGRFEKYGSGRQIQERLAATLGRFDTLNVDMIFNMPTQTDHLLETDLAMLRELLPDQVTYYPLMTARSVFTQLTRALGSVDYRQEKRFYFAILAALKGEYSHSTAWCFSRRAQMIDEYIISYDNYAAAGSGAFGYLGSTIYANTFSLEEYVERVRARRFPVARVREFGRYETILYHFLMKLFGLELDKQAFAERFGKSYARALFPLPPLLRLVGAVTEGERFVRLTDRGCYYWVMAMREFFIAVDTMRDRCRGELVDKNAPF